MISRYHFSIDILPSISEEGANGYFFHKFYGYYVAGYMEDLTRMEKVKNIRPLPEIDAYMKVPINLNFQT